MHVRLLILPWLLLAASHVHAENDPQSLSEESREIIKTFADRLQRELQQAMADGGPVNAIEVCRIRAPEIAAELSTDGWLVKRTSLKVRNPLNAPDAFEREVLTDFEAKKAQGWEIEKLAYYKMKEYGETSEFRYMKAIPTQALCLTCHGEDIPADVLKRLDAAYPDDEARGYREGDIRGAFSLRKRIRLSPAEEDRQQVQKDPLFRPIAARPTAHD